VIVDGDVEELPVGAAGLVLGVAGDAMASLDDARELLDVDVQHVAQRSMFIMGHRYLQLRMPCFVELEALEDAADCGAVPAGSLRDPPI
jgi:hypothetical protein